VKINQFKTKTPQKPTNRTYIIGNGQIERELRVELEEYAEEVRVARVELDQMGEFKSEYERRGRLLTAAQREADKVPALMEQITDLRSALIEMREVLTEDTNQKATESVAS
jgi:hypothetical protein